MHFLAFSDAREYQEEGRFISPNGFVKRLVMPFRSAVVCLILSLKHCPKWFPKVPSSAILFNSGNSEPLEFLSLFYCHQLCVFKLSGLSFVPSYAGQIVSIQQNICPEGNYCSCHKRLFEVTAATGMSLMALQPSKTSVYFTWNCLQVTSSMNLCRLQD